MTSRKATYILVAVIAVLLIGAIVHYIRRNGTSNAKQVHIAANLPLSGPLATYGVAVREGASLRLSDENVTGPETSLNVDWQDNAGDPKTAVTILQRQLLSDPTVYISGVKPQTMAIKADVSAAGLPHFVWIFDAVINDGTNNNFRTWVSYKIEPAQYIAYAKQRAAKRIAIVYVQLPHTVDEFQRIVEPELTHLGMTLNVQPYEFGKTDYRDVALKMAAFKPDLIILNGFQSDLVGLVRALRPLRLLTDGNAIATYDLLDAAKILGPDEIEGLRVITPAFELQREKQKVVEWRRRFVSANGHEPLYTSAFAYDMMTAIVAASRSITLPASHDAWIRALKQVDTDGITGPIRFDSDGDMVTPLQIGVYRNGVLIPLQ